MSYEDILTEVDGPVLTITINRPEAGNKFRHQTCLELFDALQKFRLDREVRAAILTGAGEKFFCIGGEHDPLTSLDQSQVLPIIDVYQAIDTIPKPVIAAVNGFAVGGGNVLHTVCDLSIASSTAVFRQVGPMVGSFDAGYGTWYLEDTIGRKRAKEMWYLNGKFTAAKAEAMGLVNEVVEPNKLMNRATEIAREISTRSPLAIGALKGAFSARHNGVSGQARMAHDQQLTLYLQTQEAHEVSASFGERRQPNTESFWS
ncbi:enoyl-CoA hydratase-related protein [Mycolicibacterium smegmatis]|uniref:1,4-Dihydroxy-2-naphthoate synthase n=3 Tax=Mycobacteriaceae TaxID=1762 RepID=I7FP41_MYCS2|nr:enoyl-CoA hydratase-related protein [Mycolicibacterium smegmatis]VTP02495.1 1,4-Dihydroxy-2-naphthoyl-CoA synthase [Mycobacterium riyadhense]ABK72489.1 naphthoate synthase [Mycolicibacterium smegmatis MC2 155]AFP40473.1 1,4-Dihydroxy-2-naphthoate synthase [Mycolicibacterium smegmatis MC2 155]AIU09215.1 crotonase [Mycolicibacterium smegmatis MC2 155]AIU15840.1 crotonase [Mycolicibacterium smegmatis]